MQELVHCVRNMRMMLSGHLGSERYHSGLAVLPGLFFYIFPDEHAKRDPFTLD